MRPPPMLVVLLLVSTLSACGTESAPKLAGPPPTPEASERIEVHASSSDLTFEGRPYSLSCGVVDPATVDPEPLGTAVESGRQIAFHAIEGVDPTVLVAHDSPCDLVEGQQWGIALGMDRYFDADGVSPEANEAACTVMLFDPDPAEGYDCGSSPPAAP